jgi:O-antigen/teichoic acid export membrane protein
MLQSIGTTIGWIYLSTGRTDLMLRWTAFVASLVLPGFAAGLYLGGLKGLTIGYAVTAGLLFLPSLVPAFRIIHLPRGEAFRALLPLFLAAAGMAALLLATRWLLELILGPAARLAVLLPLGALAYFGLLERLGQSPRARVATLWAALRGR